jgi:hypothetical protein
MKGDEDGVLDEMMRLRIRANNPNIIISTHPIGTTSTKFMLKNLSQSKNCLKLSGNSIFGITDGKPANIWYVTNKIFAPETTILDLSRLFLDQRLNLMKINKKAIMKATLRRKVVRTFPGVISHLTHIPVEGLGE